ncbi:MAG: cob(I)yrinic acid a,c-diamide adenosyltransferase [Bacteroidales bacterium]|nr:cob(I)yrinic acid a,c-diamide adenosyltransferase [Bacteroidales bacterium]
MSKIYTKGGDDGTTSLLSGKRVSKYHPRVEAYGNVDELSSNIGLLRGHNISEEIKQELQCIQQTLFDIMGLLACDQGKYVDKLNPVEDSSIQFLEKSIDKMTAKLPPLANFVLPGGIIEVGMAHVCRSICRRAERRVVEFADMEPVESNIIIFINRLSDYLFTLTRKIAQDAGYEQIKTK